MAEGFTHLAGSVAEAEGRLRQRCAWCGALLFDYVLANIAYKSDTPEDEWRPATAEPGTWWHVEGNGGWLLPFEPHESNEGAIAIPEDCCINLDPDVTA